MAGKDGKQIVLVTGPSGAGRTTAIHALEDSGFEVIDNLPLSLIPAVIDAPSDGRPLALGTDIRNRDFSVAQLIEVIDRLTGDPAVHSQLLYLDCAATDLVRRFSETRRKHPVRPDESPLSGIEHELQILQPIKARADVLIDTSKLSPHDLKSEVRQWFAKDTEKLMTVSVQSFSYKRGLPRSVDMMFDCRFLQNPHWQPDLRPLFGTDAPVQDFVASDPNYGAFLDRVFDLVTLVLPQHMAEGRSHVSIAFGCTGGRHRSVALAEALFQKLSSVGDWHLSVRHRELERSAPTGR